jgi:hypothetical protein
MKRVLRSSGGTALQFSAQRKPHRETFVARLALAFHSKPNPEPGTAAPASGAVFHPPQNIPQLLSGLDPDVVELP